MSGWFGSGGLGILGSGMPRQQYDPEDDPMTRLYGMLGAGAAGGGLGASTQPPLRRMNGTPRTMYGGTPADVGGMDEADYITRLRQPKRSPFPSGGYGYADPLGIGAAGLGNPNAYSSSFSRGGVPGINGVQGPHVSAAMYTMQDMADQMRQNNRMNPKAPKPRNPQMDALMAAIGGYEDAHAARQRMMDNNMAAIGAMGRPNGGFVRDANGRRSLPLVAPNGNIDSELARAAQIRADGRLAQGGMDQFTRKWRGINQNMPMSVEEDGVSPALADRRAKLMADMATANRARSGSASVPKGQMGVQAGTPDGGYSPDALFRYDKQRRQDAIARGQEFRKNRMAEIANAMPQAPDPSQHMAWAMMNMIPGDHQHNAMVANMANMMYHGGVQAYNASMQNRYLQDKMRQDRELGVSALGLKAREAGVDPNQVLPGHHGQPAFPNQPPPVFDPSKMHDVLGRIADMPDAAAYQHAAGQGVNSMHLDQYIAQNMNPSSWMESGLDKALRIRRLEQARRLRGMYPNPPANPNAPLAPTAPQQPDAMAGMFPGNPGF